LNNRASSWLSQFPLRLWQDIRFALKVSASNPKFTVVAVLTLAIGIAVNSTVFSWIDGILLHPYAGVKDTRGLALIETETVAGERFVDLSMCPRAAQPASIPWSRSIASKFAWAR
jgi:hypothetical protein